jgi:hypothetical protein
LAAWVEQNIQRRRKALEDDLEANVMIKDRVVSTALSSIPGVERHLHNARQAKLIYDNQFTTDHMSHATVSRSDMRKKYSVKQ